MGKWLVVADVRLGCARWLLMDECVCCQEELMCLFFL